MADWHRPNQEIRPFVPPLTSSSHYGKLRGPLQRGRRPSNGTFWTVVNHAMNDDPVASVASAADRWAQLIVQATESVTPVQSLDDWAALARMSQRTLRNRCLAAGVRAKSSLDLARVLWAVRRLGTAGWPTMWDAMGETGDTDPRTMVRLLRGAGLDRRDTVPPVERLLTCQTFVAPGPSLRKLRLALTAKAANGWR